MPMDLFGIRIQQKDAKTKTCVLLKQSLTHVTYASLITHINFANSIGEEKRNLII